MPLYHERPLACVFTLSYMIITNIVLMNLLLAVITSLPKPAAIDSLSLALRHVFKLLAIVWAAIAWNRFYV